VSSSAPGSWLCPRCFGFGVGLRHSFVPEHRPCVHGHICPMPFRPWVSGPWVSSPWAIDGIGVRVCMARSVQRLLLPPLDARCRTCDILLRIYGYLLGPCVGWGGASHRSPSPHVSAVGWVGCRMLHGLHHRLSRCAGCALALQLSSHS
jgi:hypothetical protein